MARAKVGPKRSPDGTWPALDDETVIRILTLLREGAESGVTHVYLAGGRLRRLDGSALVAEEHASAQPYLWPIAHDVRPAALALGARGCEDCHDASAPIFFGQVTVDSPLGSDRTASRPMWRFQKGLDAEAAAEFADAFRYRSWLKGTLTGAVGVLLLVVLGYAVTGLKGLSATTGTTRWIRVAANIGGAVSGVAIVATGWSELWSGEALTGSRLMLHVATAPVFLVAALVAALFWAHRNRFGRADWNRLRRPLGKAAEHRANPYLVLLRKVSFWVAAIAVVPSAVSATLAMFPIMASVWQTSLFAIHRYAVGVFIASAALFTVLGLIAWIRRYRDDPDARPDAPPAGPAA
jgi:cytochrome b subunit of formate dehydrogenase